MSYFKGYDWTELAKHWGLIGDHYDFDEELIINQMLEIINNAMREMMIKKDYKEGSNQIVQDIREYMRAMARCEHDSRRELYKTLANKCCDWTVLDYCRVKENLKKMWT